MGAELSSPLCACCAQHEKDDELVFASDAELIRSWHGSERKPRKAQVCEDVTEKDPRDALRALRDEVSMSDGEASKTSLRREARTRYIALMYLSVLALQAICIANQWWHGVVGSLAILVCGQVYDFMKAEAILPVQSDESTLDPKVPIPDRDHEQVATDTAPSFWLLIRKYDWALEYTVNLNPDGTVNTTEPLLLSWKKLRSAPEEDPHLDKSIKSLTEGAPVACERNIWRYTFSVKQGEIAAALNVAKMITFSVRPDGVFAKKDGSNVCITHAWIHVDYIWGVPNMSTVSVVLHDHNDVVLSSEDVKRLAAPA